LGVGRLLQRADCEAGTKMSLLDTTGMLL